MTKARRTRSNFSQQFSAILQIEFDLVAKLVAKRSCREVAMCANVCNFRLSNFEQNEPLQLIFLCDFMLKVAVDSDQACLICATISLAIFFLNIKCQWLRQQLHKIAMCAITLKESCWLCFLTLKGNFPYFLTSATCGQFHRLLSKSG